MSDLEIARKFDLSSNVVYDIREVADGIQILFRFSNGKGVSVVRHSFSYGGTNGFWEAAPLNYLSDGWEWEFIGMSHNLPGFADRDDVAGWLTEPEVDEILAMVASL